MAKSIYERVRAAQAKAEKDRKAAEYKAGEPARRAAAGRFAADVKRERGIERALETGVARNRAERDALYRDLIGDAE
jgi:hypothetical protein